MRDLITNFAILNFAPPSSLTPTTVVPENNCAWHPAKAIAVFCTTCSVFICQECFGTSAAPHAPHSRISIQEAEDLLISERGDVMFEISEIEQHSMHALAIEVTRQQELDAELIRIRERAVQHFNATVEALRAKLDALTQQLESYRHRIHQGLSDSLNKQTRLQDLQSHIPEGDDLKSLAEFAIYRAGIKRELATLAETGDFATDLANIILDYRFHPAPQKLPAPVLHVNNLMHAELFKLDVPPELNVPTTMPIYERKPIPRTTSNDQLRS